MNHPLRMIASCPRTTRFSTLRWQIPGLTVEAGWRALRAAFAAADHAGGQQTVKLLCDDRLVTARDHWPHRGHPSPTPDDWMASLPGGTFLAWARSIQTLDRPLFESLVQAAAAVFVCQGMPSGTLEAELFLGDYEQTPGGIHREACSNTHLVLSGAKTMHLWDPGNWPSHEIPRRHDCAAGSGTPEEYLPGMGFAQAQCAAESLYVRAGTGVFWTAGTWHVGQTHGPAMALNLAAYQRGFDPEPILRGWGAELNGEVPSDWLDRYREHIRVDQSADLLLARLSALGMRPAHPVRRPLCGRTGHWRNHAPVLWTIANSHLLVATMGACRREVHTAVTAQWLSQPREVGIEMPISHEVRNLAAWLHEQGVYDVTPDDISTTIYRRRGSDEFMDSRGHQPVRAVRRCVRAASR